LSMPVLNGLDLIVAIRADDEIADLPVVVITSFGEEIPEAALGVGETNTINRPTEMERILDVIDAAVSRLSKANLRSYGGPLSELSGKNSRAGATTGPATIPP